MIFHWYQLLQLIVAVVLLSYIPYAVKCYKNNSKLKTKKNILYLVVVVIYLFGYTYQIGDYKQQEVTISTFDSDVSTNNLTIKKQAYKMYEASDHEDEIKNITGNK